MFEEYDCFILKKSIPTVPEIPLGIIGVVLLKLGVDSNGMKMYEVEFVDNNGYNLNNTTYTISENYMESV